MVADNDKEMTPVPSEREEEARSTKTEEGSQGDAPVAEVVEEMTAEEEVSPEEGAEPADLERLRAELEGARKQSEEYLDQWRRTAAEFANYRKRVEKERAEFATQANARLIGRLLTILDDFERAFATVPEGLLGLTWIEGLALIHRKLQVILEGEGLEVIDTAGKTFDPLEHQAVTYEAVEGYEDGQIIGEVQKGYRLGARVLRPAMVRVARAAEEAVPREASPKESAADEESGEDTAGSEER